MNPLDFLYRAVVLIAVSSLAIVMLSVVIAMMIGLFDPVVDNHEIFKVITPAFSMIVGTFGGLIGGIAIGRSGKES